jgi:DNA-binding transcriptional ArsR family regulator
MAMQARLRLSRLDQIRALADPLRIRLVEALVARELSVADLAQAVGTPVTRLYHHVTLLLEAGLIQEASRVRRRGVEERIYRATAREFRMDGSLLDVDTDGGHSVEDLVKLSRSVLGTALEELTDGIRRGDVRPERPGKGVILQGRSLQLTPAGFEALARELPAWIEAFARRQKAARGGGRYRLAFAVFPSARKTRSRLGQEGRRETPSRADAGVGRRKRQK